MAYVYRHIRLDKNIPFYIGISKKNDAKYSRAFNFDFRHRNELWMRIFNKTEIRVEILFDNVDYDFAKKKEIEFIELYKRVADGGTLANLTIGGDGVTGFKNTKLSERNKTGIWRGKRHSDESKNKIRLANKGRRFSESHKNRLSKVASERIFDKNSNYKGCIICHKNGVPAGRFLSLKDAAMQLNIPQSTISRAINGRNINKSGFTFVRE